MNKKTGEIFIFLIFITIIVGIFIFSANQFFSQKNIDDNKREDMILKNNTVDSKTLIKSMEMNNESVNKKLLEVANIKIDIANEKENAYDKAINQIKLLVTFFSSVLIFIAIFFGLYKDKKIVDAKEELLKSIEEKKKNLEENNSLHMEKKIFELEKNNIIKIDEIKKLALVDIEDLQKRIRELEMGKKYLEDKNLEENNKEEISPKDNNPYE